MINALRRTRRRTRDRVLQALLFLLAGALLGGAGPAIAISQPLYWYDGARKVPLHAETGTHSKAESRPSHFRAAPGGPAYRNDGTFYVCYPEDWSRSQRRALEGRYRLRRAKADTGIPAIILYDASVPAQAVATANRIYEQTGVDCAAPLWKKPVTRKYGFFLGDQPIDPLFDEQWYLQSTDQACFNTTAEDIGAVPAWQKSVGEGITIAVVDDGVELTHSDLVENLLPTGHADFVGGPVTDRWGEHGTAVAGIAAARGFNGRGIAGAAPEASLLSLRILPEEDLLIEDTVQAQALDFADVSVDIYNNSWGAPDGSEYAFEGLSPLARAAVARGAEQGRGGLGSIYVWAAGNGGPGADANLDGYANSRYAIAVTASACDGKAASYAEPGSNILLNAPSSETHSALVTTDRSGTAGFNTGVFSFDLADLDYTRTFSGTSGATPMVAGAAALVLGVNPGLNWREVQQVLALSADWNDPGHFGWRFNTAGLAINEQYGLGRLNAAAAVKMAENWQVSLKPEQQIRYRRSVNQTIPDNDPRGLVSQILVSEPLRVETVLVTVNIPDHSYWGDLSMFLTSPGGTRVRLVQESSFLAQSAVGLGYRDWIFKDALHLGEASQGTWTLEVIDNASRDTGVLVSWQLEIFGTSLPVTAGELPLHCEAVSASRPGVTVPGAVHLGGSRHGSQPFAAIAGTRWEDYGIVTAVASGVPVGRHQAVAFFQGPAGDQAWFMKTGSGWQVWDNDANSLIGFADSGEMVNRLHQGRLLPGSYQLWAGYNDPSGELFYCPEPLLIQVEE